GARCSALPLPHRVPARVVGSPVEGSGADVVMSKLAISLPLVAGFGPFTRASQRPPAAAPFVAPRHFPTTVTVPVASLMTYAVPLNVPNPVGPEVPLCSSFDRTTRVPVPFGSGTRVIPLK